MTTSPVASAEIQALAFALMEMAAPSSWGDGSPQSTEAATLYPGALEAALRSADWSFASRLVDLPAATAEVVDPDLPHAYALPVDVLLVRHVGPTYRHARWRIDGRVLRAELPAPLRLRYTGRIEREDALPADFRQLVAFHLAIQLSPRFASSAGRVESLTQRLAIALDAAIRSDRAQASPRRWDGRDQEAEGDWVAAVLR